MSKIHYFQRYSSVENTVTNNTLQLLARIYSYSSQKASLFLSELTNEPIEIGIEIMQQKPGISSVPDGAIIQRSFKVLIESKVDSPATHSQLIKHAGNFDGESKQILLLLTKQRINAADESSIRKKIHSKYKSVIFRNITYEDICLAIDGLFQSYEYEMNDLMNDYIEYCNDSNLSDQSKYLMRIPPCGASLALNLKYGVYFQPSDRGYSNHKYIGIYSQKRVQAIWEIKSVYDASFDGVELKTAFVSGEKTTKYDNKITAIIQDAKRDCGYSMLNTNRFFCGEPILTNFVKKSSGGIQGARLINLKKHIGEFTSVSDISEKLRNVAWE